MGGNIRSIIPAEHEPAGTSDQASPSLHAKTYHWGVNLVLISVLLVRKEPLAIQKVKIPHARTVLNQQY